METMTVLLGFDDYETEKKQRREKSDEITVSVERADQLRERGLARKKPVQAKKPEPTPDPEPAATSAD